MTQPTVGQPDVTEDAGAEPANRSSRAGLLADVAWVLGSYVVLGLLGALLWWLLVDPAYFTKAASGGLAMGEVQLSRRFNADGWYVVIAAVLGLLSGSVLTWWRSRDFLLTSALLLVGAGVAALVMTLVGRALGPADPGSLAAAAAVGDRLPVQLEVAATVCYLVWPIAVLIGALFVLWSPPADTPR
jgi:hypothetical protein